MSKIQKELAEATGKKPESGQSIKDEAYVKELMRGVAKLSDGDWDKLSTDAQKWYNASADSVKAGKGVVAFPDAEAEEEAPRSRRRADPEDEKPATSAKPAKGDKVAVETVKGNKYEGKVVAPDDDGYLVLDDGGKDELSLKWANIKSCEPVGAKKEEQPAEEGRRSRRRGEDEDPPAAADPKVGDTVEIKTKRGTIKVGNVIELKPGKMIAVKDAAGDEFEYEADRIESITVKVSAGGAEPEGRRRRGGEDEDAPRSRDSKGDKDKDEGDKKDMGIGEKARLYIVKNQGLSKDEFVKAALKEWPTAKENTLRLIYGDVHKLLGMLKAEGFLKK